MNRPGKPPRNGDSLRLGTERLILRPMLGADLDALLLSFIPQQRRQKEREKLLSALQKGDKVITSGGIHGTMAGLEEKTVLLQIADGVKVKVDRGSISNVVKEG